MAIDGLKQFLPQAQTITTNLMDYKVYDAILELQRKVQELVGYTSGLESAIVDLTNKNEELNARVADLENQLNP